MMPEWIWQASTGVGVRTYQKCRSKRKKKGLRFSLQALFVLLLTVLGH
jgi:predicted branched-subunit amino acid permease